MPLEAGTRWLVQMRSDSLSSLLTVSQLKAKSHGLGLISRELALLRAEWGLQLIGLAPVPGVANEWADALSRLRAPVPKQVPGPLARLTVERPPRRDARPGGRGTSDRCVARRARWPRASEVDALRGVI